MSTTRVINLTTGGQIYISKIKGFRKWIVRDMCSDSIGVIRPLNSGYIWYRYGVRPIRQFHSIREAAKNLATFGVERIPEKEQLLSIPEILEEASKRTRGKLE